MVSNSLRQLRGAPMEQAQIYRDFLPARTKIITNLYLSGDAKLAQITAAVERSQNALRQLQDSCNQAAERIRSASLSQDVEISEAAIEGVWRAFKHGVALRGVVQEYVETNNKDGLNALSLEVGMLQRAGILGYPTSLPRERVLVEARQTIAEGYRQIADANELSQMAETQELHCMAQLQANFQTLQNWFLENLKPQVISGMQSRLESLWPWYGLNDEPRTKLRTAGIEWDALPQQKILLGSDVVIPVPSEISGQQGSSQAPTGGYLYNGPGAPSQWKEKALKSMRGGS